ncbi:MAG TPA: hypothetical protein VHM19_11350, partial [Polyangiales bacterium]|nr:hypothetical protein [Polyangiales bacterium]
LWAARYSERARPWLADALWFVIPLLPVINIVPLNLKPLVANRFLYLPMLGVAALLARALAAAVGRPGPRAPATVISMVIAFVACIVVTTRYLPAFATDEASIAYEHALHPEDTMLLADLANRQAGRGQLHEALLTALEGYKAAAQQREHTPRIRFLLLAARYLNDGLHDHQHTELRALDAFYSALEQGQEARLEVPPLRIVTQLGDKDRAMLRRDIDDFVVPRAMLAARMGNLPLAIAQLSRAGQEDSRQARAFRMLALLLERSEQHEAALGALARAEAAAPAHAETILIRKRITDAHALFERAAADPAQGVVARAHAFLILGSPALAARTMDAALASQPDEPLFLATRARIDAIDGNFAAARGRVQAAQTRLPARAEDFAAVLREIEAAEDQASAKN